jgi:phage terminase large subunit
MTQPTEEEPKQRAQIALPPKLVPVFAGRSRYRCSFGGRGSGKTRSFALMTAIKGYEWGMSGKTGQILCAREFMNSLDDSSLEEIKIAIRSIPWLNDYYEVGEKFIRSKDGRVHYTFAGLRRSLDSIKSKARILLAWVDEAEGVSDIAWQKLIPTVREENSEIWVTWNPESKYSATHERFRTNTPDNAKIAELNFRDNPWFPDVLDQERLEDKRKRPDVYEHVWEGGFLIFTEGSYYTEEMRRAKNEGRIGNVAYERSKNVVTAWDLGIGDSTAIWFVQYIGAEIRVIDYFEGSGVGLDYYAKVLQDKGYVYDTHILPHDVQVRELGTGKSRLEILRTLGLNNIDIAPKLMIDDGIQSVRSILDKCWFDEKKCERGIDCLVNYQREYDDTGQTWRQRPKHDWSSHGADAFRYLAIGYSSTASWGEPIRRNLQGVA